MTMTERPGVVDALAEQVAAEATLLALEQVGEALELALAGAADGAAAAAVVDERVDGFLQHALFVAHDDVGRAQLHQPLEPVVAVDDAAVEVVEVAGGEAAAVELDHGAQLGRDDGQRGEDHPLGPVARLAEVLDDAQPLGGLLAPLLALGGAHLAAQLVGHAFEVELGDDVAHGLGAHAGGEDVAPALGELAVAVLAEAVASLRAT